MTLDKLLPYLITSVCSLIVGYVLGYLNHGLTKNREAGTRRRRFRDALRAVATQIDDAKWMTFYQTYQETIPTVKAECDRIFEDVRFWRRKSFNVALERYCSFKQSGLELKRPPSPAELPEYMKKNKAKREESKAMLRSVLEEIANAAR